MAVSGVFAEVLEESSGKTPGKLLEIFPESQNATNTRIRPYCQDLVPTFRAGCFLKSTVPAFSSFSDFREINSGNKN